MSDKKNESKKNDDPFGKPVVGKATALPHGGTIFPPLLERDE